MSINTKRKRYFIEPIRIDERDPSIFADLAYFFDREDVLNEIGLQRKAWIGDKTIPHDEIDDFINRDMNSEDAKKFWWEFWPGIFRMARKYGLKENLVSPIIAAILSGVITEKDYLRIFKEPPIYSLPEEYRLSDEVIYISNNVRSIDLQTLRTKVDDKSIATIQRDRKWYWLYQKMGYRKLEKHLGENIETIRSVIRSYNDKLLTYYRVV